MLVIKVKPFSVFDERSDTFITVDQHTELRLENSLYAIAQWEMKYKKQWLPESNKNPYAKQKEPQRTPEETMYFIKCMVTNIDINDFDDKILYGLTEEDFIKIRDYLQDSQSALTSIPETKEDKKNRQQVKMTSERIYAWMSEQQIPWEAQYWNINRLFNVIQIINYDNTPDDKKKRMKPSEIARDYAAINEQRLKQLGKTKG